MALFSDYIDDQISRILLCVCIGLLTVALYKAYHVPDLAGYLALRCPAADHAAVKAWTYTDSDGNQLVAVCRDDPAKYPMLLLQQDGPAAQKLLAYAHKLLDE